MTSAKGIIWDRGEHPLGREVWEQWVRGQQETPDYFSREQLLVCAPLPHSGVDSEQARKKAKHVIAGPGEIRAACKRLVAQLPDSLQAAVQDDAEALSALLTGLCPSSPWLTLAIEILGVYGCARWHQVCITLSTGHCHHHVVEGGATTVSVRLSVRLSLCLSLSLARALSLSLFLLPLSFSLFLLPLSFSLSFSLFLSLSLSASETT